MHVDIHIATFVPRREQDTATAAVMLHILERVDHVGNEAEAKGEAEGDAGPGVSGVSRVIADLCHTSLPTARAIHWRRSHTQIRDRSCHLVLIALILTSAATTTHILRLTLALMNRATLILLRGRLAVHLLLLIHWLLIRILLHHARLLLVVHAVGWLLIHHWLLLLGHGRRGLQWWW